MALEDRATARLGRSLVDGFTADRVVRALVRIRRERNVGGDDRAALRRGLDLISRVSRGDWAFEGQEPDRRTLGSAGVPGEGPSFFLHAEEEANVRRLQRNLKRLLQREIPTGTDFAEIEDFFVHLSQTILKSSQTIERRPRRPGSVLLGARLWRSSPEVGETISSAPR